MSFLNKPKKKTQKGSEFILKLSIETVSFDNHFLLQELEWMISFTSSEVQFFLFRITEQNKTIMFAKKKFWKFREL